MSKPTIHFAYSVPLGKNIVRRGIDKALRLSHLPMLHRFGWEPLIPWQYPVRSPHCISYNLLHAFKSRGYPVRFYNMFEKTVCSMKPGDIFIGCPSAAEGLGSTRSGSDDRFSVTSRTIREYPRRQNYVIMPYAHDPLYVNWSKELVRDNAKYGGGTIFVGGEIWARDWADKSPYADIDLLRKRHVIMGINPADYPLVKTSFNPKGQRKFLYIGHTAWYKNTKELERIATRIPNFVGGHLGGGEIAGWKKLSNFAKLTPEFMTKIAEDYDFLVSVSTADPGATTIVEQMCSGLVIATTPETGYEYPSLIKLSTHDTEANVEALQALQFADDQELFARQKQNLEIAKAHHSWKQFCDSIMDFMEL